MRLSDNPYWLVGVQLLDGVGAGLYGALFPLIVADLMEGTGRFNVAQGAMQTAQGIGAALSTTVAGLVVVAAGYSAAFLTLAAIAGAGLLLFWLAMPETWTGRGRASPRPSRRSTARASKPLPGRIGRPMLQRLDPRPQPATPSDPGPLAGQAPSGAGWRRRRHHSAREWARSRLLSRSGAWRLPAPWSADLRETAAVLVFLGDLRRGRDRQAAGLSHRPRRRGAARREPDGRLRRAHAWRRPTAPSTSTRSRSCSA